MSIVDRQNYPKKGEKVKICKNCRFYVESKLGRTVRGYSGHCIINVLLDCSIHRDRKLNPPEVMSNGFWSEYEERKDDD